MLISCTDITFQITCSRFLSNHCIKTYCMFFFHCENTILYTSHRTILYLHLDDICWILLGQHKSQHTTLRRQSDFPLRRLASQNNSSVHNYQDMSVKLGTFYRKYIVFILTSSIPIAVTASIFCIVKPLWNEISAGTWVGL